MQLILHDLIIMTMPREEDYNFFYPTLDWLWYIARWKQVDTVVSMDCHTLEALRIPWEFNASLLCQDIDVCHLCIAEYW